jgi:hypothetical protein
MMMGRTRSAAPSTQGPSSGLGACAVMLINVRVEKQRGGVLMCVSRWVQWRGPARGRAVRRGARPWPLMLYRSPPLVDGARAHAPHARPRPALNLQSM